MQIKTPHCAVVDPFTGESTNRLRRSNICNQLRIRERVTPDFSELTLFKEIPLFTYGEEMDKGRWNYLLEGAKRYGSAHSVSPNFVMKTDASLRNPVVFEVDANHETRAKIRGVLYGVTVEHIHMLDGILRNRKDRIRVKRGFLCERQIPGVVAYRQMSFIKAYIYLGSEEYIEQTKLLPKTRITYKLIPNIQGIEFYQHTNYDYDRNFGRSGCYYNPDANRAFDSKWDGWDM